MNSFKEYVNFVGGFSNYNIDNIDNIANTDNIYESNNYVNFTQMVGGSSNELTNLNNGKNSFVLFYADWCGHCTRFKPTWNKLKQATTASKINMLETNDESVHKKYNVQGYPTLRFYGGSDKKIIEYSGNRDIHDIANFINNIVGSKVVNL